MIITVTLNPSVDQEYLLDQVRIQKWTRPGRALRMPGGRGINVALMLNQLGYDPVAMGFLAGYNGEFIRDALRQAGITTNFTHIKGETRTNVFITFKDRAETLSIAERGPEASEEACHHLITSYRRILSRASAVVLGGSLPPGTPETIYRELSKIAKDAGLPVYIEAYGRAMLEALDTQPRLVKIPEEMVPDLIGSTTSSLETHVAAAQKVHDAGVRWSIIPYQNDSDIFVTPQGTYLATLDQSSDRATLFTARDALMAGVIVADAESMSVMDTIRFSMACAAENANHYDKHLCDRQTITRLTDTIAVRKLD